MSDVETLRQAVQRNCHLSDARHARDYTLCVYLLKMREYYRWEKGLPLSGSLPAADLGEWVVARERLWEALGGEDDFRCVPVAGGCQDPFEAEAINADLIPRGLVYSAGYGRFVKPHFFLGELLRREVRDGFEVIVSDREYARDLSAPPAMLRGDTVFVRRESLRRLLWERVEEWRWRKSPADAMGRAVACYPFDADPEGALDRMTDAELEPTVLHEVGEGRVGRLLGPAWGEMLVDVAGTRAEMPLRAVRDLVADCTVTMPSLVERGSEASIHFFFANLRGHRQALFPSLASGYQAWVREGDPEPLVATLEKGRRHWRETAEAALGLYAERGGEGTPERLADYVDSRRLG
jgi:hypothetical protein